MIDHPLVQKYRYRDDVCPLHGRNCDCLAKSRMTEADRKRVHIDLLEAELKRFARQGQHAWEIGSSHATAA